MANIKTYYMNTGVRPFDFDPPAAMAFMKGYKDSGNGVYVIPFDCEEVGEGFKPYQADDYFVENSEGNICRQISNTILKSKYVHFKKH